jgi:alkanesulfonate monooxygenase SsuD/methylene tetrahydromethanopterin reductase-like flavin-dependent oxidoreductase (luciferase family)
MLEMAARYADSWNADLGNTPESIKAQLEAVDAACHTVGRNPATLARSATLAVDVSGPSLPDEDWVTHVWNSFDHLADIPLSGTSEELATALRTYAAAGIDNVQVWLNPSTIAGIEAFAPVLKLLEDR